MENTTHPPTATNFKSFETLLKKIKSKSTEEM